MRLGEHVVVHSLPCDRSSLLEAIGQVAVGVPEELREDRLGREPRLHKFTQPSRAGRRTGLRDRASIRRFGVERRRAGGIRRAGQAPAGPFGDGRGTVGHAERWVEVLPSGRPDQPFGRIEEVDAEVGQQGQAMG